MWGKVMAKRPIGDWSIDSLNNRFCYWQGDDGIRYLFSQISPNDISSFSECVLLLATEEEAHPHMRWIGEIEALSPLALKDVNIEDLAHLSIYVHLLAGSREERRKVITDLSHAPDKAACRLTA